MCCTWFAHDCAWATWAYVLKTVRSAVRLSKISNCALECDYYYYCYYYYYYIASNAQKMQWHRCQQCSLFISLFSHIILSFLSGSQHQLMVSFSQSNILSTFFMTIECFVILAVAACSGCMEINMFCNFLSVKGVGFWRENHRTGRERRRGRNGNSWSIKHF